MIAIFVFLNRDEDVATGLAGLRAAIWTGTVGWPGVPVPGSQWACCDDSSIETIDRVTFNAPVAKGQPDLTIEVRASRDKLRHLVDGHRFQATVAY